MSKEGLNYQTTFVAITRPPDVRLGRRCRRSKALAEIYTMVAARGLWAKIYKKSTLTPRKNEFDNQ